MKNAFTMIELVFVIVVIGILAAAAIPRFDRDSVIEAANQIVSDIRYTQHLALMDYKFDLNDQQWYKSRWTYEISQTEKGSNKLISSTIYSDHKGKHSGSPDFGEIAVDPQFPDKLLTGGSAGGITYKDPRISENMLLGKKFGITEFNFGGSCGGNNNKKISFDEFGRAYTALQKASHPGDKVMSGKGKGDDNCTITIKDEADKVAVISLVPETGYIKITQYPSID